MAIREKVAFEIYSRTMLEKGISKAATAQVFAKHIEEELRKEKARDEERSEALPKEVRPKRPKESALLAAIAGARSLQYLLDAIYHVTEPQEI